MRKGTGAVKRYCDVAEGEGTGTWGTEILTWAISSCTYHVDGPRKIKIEGCDMNRDNIRLMLSFNSYRARVKIPSFGGLNN